MNTDIYFQISAPASLSIFGEHAKNRIRASINLRTTLIFREVPASLPNDINYIEINFPRINLLHKVKLKTFLNFYNNCVENMELLHEILQCTFQYEPNYQKIFLQIFYYLFVRITYEEQIKIKSFSILLTTQLISNGEFMSLASLKVCLAACLLHWSRLQKGAHSIFDIIDLKKIYVYAKCCEENVSESDIIDILVCTFGSIIKYERGQNICKWFRLPNMKILLVDSNQAQDVKVQKRVAEFMNTVPELGNSILDNIDIVTNMANDAFQKIFDIYENNELSIEMKNDCFLQQQKALDICTRWNHRLLRKLDVSYIRLDKICKMAKNLGFSGKFTDLDNGRYVYIWRTYKSVIFIMILMDKLKTHGFDVIQTKLFCTGVKIE